MAFEDREIGLDDVGRICIKHWKLLLFPTLIATLLAMVYAVRMPKTYESFSFVRIGSDGNGMFEQISNISDIMSTIPIEQEIAKRAGNADYREVVGITYTDASNSNTNLLRISFVSETPQKAAKIVSIASDLLIERHRELYAESLKNTKEVVQFVKETIKPIPLSSGIREFRLVPTTVIIPAILNTDPVKTNKKIVVIGTFIVVFLTMFIISFYLEGRKHRKS
jgi:hypothetical protein